MCVLRSLICSPHYNPSSQFSFSKAVLERAKPSRSFPSTALCFPTLACHHPIFYWSSLNFHPVRDRCLPSKPKAGLRWSICADTNVQEFECIQGNIYTFSGHCTEWVNMRSMIRNIQTFMCCQQPSKFQSSSLNPQCRLAQPGLHHVASHSNTACSPDAGSCHCNYY